MNAELSPFPSSSMQNMMHIQANHISGD
uniref:Uncharacterized protein n=1 Tax=Musa acuminata subsp. malaccensis TaxID=214687 RepID=A0A804IHL2_MUSAM